MRQFGQGAIKTSVRCRALDEIAAEGSRTSGRWRVSRELVETPKVLECGCPLPLFYRNTRERNVESRVRGRGSLVLGISVLAVGLLSDWFTVALAADITNATTPNFLIILADDMGYSDAGCYGGEIQTPNIDRLAKEGIRFTQFYNTARCWPSRAALLTGYYAQEVHRDALPGLGGGASGQRPEWAQLLPAYLHPLGYRSYHSGKWHVDGKVLAGGFDHSYAVYDQDRHFSPKNHALDDEPLPAIKTNGYYSTTAIAQHAIELLTAHQAKFKGQPFFLYLAFTCPHFPLQALPEDIAIYKNRYVAGWEALRQERYARMNKMGLINCSLSKLQRDVAPGWNLSEEKLRDEIGPGEIGRAVAWDSLTAEQKVLQPIKMAIHAAMIHRMDIEIGRVLDQIKRMGVDDNTVIFFASDNGASAEQIIRGDRHDRSAPPGSAQTYLSIGPGWSSAANTPLRLHKSWVHEGGISTPLIVHWPQGIRAHGEVRQNPGHLIDIAPTVLELAGGTWPKTHDGKPVPTPPGKSLVPVFSKDGSVSHDYLWWYHDDNRAMRVGDWKVVADHQKPWELYNVASDRSECSDVSALHADLLQQLARGWTNHMEEFRKVAAGWK
jgi:arylsulfatase